MLPPTMSPVYGLRSATPAVNTDHHVRPDEQVSAQLSDDRLSRRELAVQRAKAKRRADR